MPSALAVTTTDGVSLTWHELFTEFAPAIHAFARSRGASSPDDIVQEVFVTAVESFDRFEGDRSGLRSLLFTLAYRRIADEHRSRFRRMEEPVAEHEVTVDDADDVEMTVTGKETADEAIAALGILDDRERRVVEMRIIQEFSPAQVAKVMGISNGNVRVIQARALMKIRKHLAATTGTTPSVAMVFAFLQAMRNRLPDDGGLGGWIAEIRASVQIPSKGSPGLDQPGVPEAAAGAAATVAASGGLASGALKVGLVVSLTTASALGTAVASSDHLPVPRFDGVHLLASGEGGPDGIPIATADPDPPSSVNDVAEPDAVVGSVGEDVPVMPDPERDPVASDPVPDQSLADEPAQGDPLTQETTGLVEDVTDNVVDPLLGGVGSVVGETVETLVDDVVQPLVDDVVVPLVEEVVDVVDQTVETVVDDVVAPVVNEVEDLVDSVVDDVVVPVVERLGKGLLR